MFTSKVQLTSSLFVLLHYSSLLPTHVRLSRLKRRQQRIDVPKSCIHMQTTCVFASHSASPRPLAVQGLVGGSRAKPTCVRLQNDYLKCSGFYLNKYSSRRRVADFDEGNHAECSYLAVDLLLRKAKISVISLENLTNIICKL